MVLIIASIAFLVMGGVLEGLFFNGFMDFHGASETSVSREFVIFTLNFIGSALMVIALLFNVLTADPEGVLSTTAILAVGAIMAIIIAFSVGAAIYSGVMAGVMGIAGAGLVGMAAVGTVSIAATGPVMVVSMIGPSLIGAAMAPAALIVGGGPAAAMGAIQLLFSLVGKGSRGPILRFGTWGKRLLSGHSPLRIPVNLLIVFFVSWPLLTMVGGIGGVFANKPALQLWETTRSRFNIVNYTLSKNKEELTYPADFYRRYLQHETDWNHIQGHGDYQLAFSDGSEAPHVLRGNRLIGEINRLTDNYDYDIQDSSIAYSPAGKGEKTIVVDVPGYTYVDTGKRYFRNSSMYEKIGQRWQKKPGWDNDFDRLSEEEQLERVYDILVKAASSDQDVSDEDFYNTALFVKQGKLVDFDEKTSTAYFARKEKDGTITLLRKDPSGQKDILSFPDNFAGEGTGYAWQAEDKRFVYADGTKLLYFVPDTGEEGIFFEGKTPIVDFNRFFTPTGERAYIFAFESRDALIHFYDKGYNHTFWIADGPSEKIRNDKADLAVTSGFYVWDGGIAMRGYNDSDLLTRYTFYNDTLGLSSDRFESKKTEFMEKFILHQEALDLYWQKEMSDKRDFAMAFGWTPEGSAAPAAEEASAAEEEMTPVHKAYLEESFHGYPAGKVNRTGGLDDISFRPAGAPEYGDNILHLSDYEAVSLYKDSFIWAYPKNFFQDMEITDRNDDHYLTFTGSDGSYLRYWTYTDDPLATVTTTDPVERLRNFEKSQEEKISDMAEIEFAEGKDYAKAFLKGKDKDDPSLTVYVLIQSFSNRYQAMMLKLPAAENDIDAYRKGYLFYVLYCSSDMADLDQATIVNGPRAYESYLSYVMPSENRDRVSEEWIRYWLP